MSKRILVRIVKQHWSWTSRSNRDEQYGCQRFEMFKLGVGPSSSHTVGPMRAALLFVQELQKRELLTQTQRVVCELMGSLGATGRGHATDKAVILGWAGKAPATVTGKESVEIPRQAEEDHVLNLAGIKSIAFDSDRDMIFRLTRFAHFILTRWIWRHWTNKAIACCAAVTTPWAAVLLWPEANAIRTYPMNL